MGLHLLRGNGMRVEQQFAEVNFDGIGAGVSDPLQFFLANERGDRDLDE